MKNLSLATKLWIPAVSLGLMVVLMTSVSAIRTTKLQAAASAEQSEQQTRLELSARWMGLAEANAARAMATTLSSDASLAEQFKQDAEATASRMAEITKKLDAGATSTEERAALAAVATQQKAFTDAMAKAQELKTAGQQDQASAQVKDVARPALAGMITAQQALMTMHEQGARMLRDKSGAERMRTVYIVSAAMSLIIGLVALGTWYLQRTICVPLKQVVDVAHAIGDGDLTVRIDTQRKDEIGEVLRSLHHMGESLARMVGEVRSGADSINTASAEIASGNQDLSQRTEQTASNLQAAASSMDQLTGTVKQSADSARQANQLASSA